jgi:hypothetical protein
MSIIPINNSNLSPFSLRAGIPPGLFSLKKSNKKTVGKDMIIDLTEHLLLRQ